jgi:RNA polymerase sigma factor (sigma-70 family)
MIQFEMDARAVQGSDAELVTRCLVGDRGAFSAIVAKYQKLICSLTYSGTGDFSRSEDLAQEIFIAAWKQLGSLREPERLRSWLCGIARNLINNSIRRDMREQIHHAGPLDTAIEHASSELPPSEKLISHEEETIVWAALERIPASYREPLILFYREDASVDAIAAQFDLSGDAVKQRLSRGREMLRNEVASVVEGALKRTSPGRIFTLSVMAALPAVVTSSAKAAILGAAGTAATPAAKGILAASGLASLLGPLLGLLGGGFGVWASWQNARYQSQRDLIRRAAIFYAASCIIFMVGTFAFRFVRHEWISSHPLAYSICLAVWILVFVGMTLIYSLGLALRIRRATAREVASGAEPLPATKWANNLKRGVAKWEGRRWQSRARFLGLPLVDISFANPNSSAVVDRAALNAFIAGPRQIARGWIAFGDRAHGLLFACGNVAFGGIAFGGVAAGIVAFGGAAVGVLAIGGGALGLAALGGFAVGGFAWGGGAGGGLACGGLAVGWLAFGGGAFAWQAAKGGFACAHHFAVGGKAIAPHANDFAAKQFLASNGFFRNAEWQMAHVLPWLRGPRFVLTTLAVSLLLPGVILLVGYRRKRIQ